MINGQKYVIKKWILVTKFLFSKKYDKFVTKIKKLPWNNKKFDEVWIKWRIKKQFKKKCIFVEKLIFCEIVKSF